MAYRTVSFSNGSSSGSSYGSPQLRGPFPYSAPPQHFQVRQTRLKHILRPAWTLMHSGSQRLQVAPYGICLGFKALRECHDCGPYAWTIIAHGGFVTHKHEDCLGPKGTTSHDCKLSCEIPRSPGPEGSPKRKANTLTKTHSPASSSTTSEKDL